MEDATAAACYITKDLHNVSCNFILDQEREIDSVLEYDMIVSQYGLDRSTQALHSRLVYDYDIDMNLDDAMGEKSKTVQFNNKTMHWDTALPISVNDGLTRLTESARASRSFG